MANKPPNTHIRAFASPRGAFRSAHRVPGSALRDFGSVNRVRNKAGSAFAGDGLVFHTAARVICSSCLEWNKKDQVSGKALEGFCMASLYHPDAGGQVAVLVEGILEKSEPLKAIEGTLEIEKVKLLAIAKALFNPNKDLQTARHMLFTAEQKFEIAKAVPVGASVMRKLGRIGSKLKNRCDKMDRVATIIFTDR